MEPRSLPELYETHEGKVTDKWSSYLRVYEELFRPYRDDPVRLLEIGIQNGGSLEIWARYFRAGTRIVGCDVNPDCGRLTYADPRISVIVGDANDAATRQRILAQSACYDIVLDDGSHRSGDIVKAFLNYFPKTAYGGIFVAEDLHCSYWQDFEGGLFDPYSSITFFKHLADIVNHESWGVARSRSDLLQGIASKYGCDLDESVLSEVHSVEFVNSICIVRKQPASQNQLGTRYVAGSVEEVVPGSLQLHGRGPNYFPDQSANPWSARERPPGEDFPRIEGLLAQATSRAGELEAQLSDRKRQVEDLNGALSRLREQHRAEREELDRELRVLKQSASWRMTAPYRWIGGRLKRLRGTAGL